MVMLHSSYNTWILFTGIIHRNCPVWGHAPLWCKLLDVHSGQYHPTSIIIIVNVELELLILAYLPAEHLEKPVYGSKICYIFKVELKNPPPQTSLVFMS